MARRQSPGHRRLARVREGIHALGRGWTLELHRHEVVGLIGAKRRRQDDARERPHRLRLPDGRALSCSRRDITSWSPDRRGRVGLARPRSSTAARSGRSRVRKNVEVAALGSGARAPRGAPPGGRAPGAARARAHAPGPRGRSRTGTSGSSAWRGPSGPSRGFCPRRAGRGPARGEVPEFAAVVRSVRDEHEAGVLRIDHNMALIMGLRPDPRARPGPDARRGHAARDPRQPRRRPRPTSARARCRGSR